jgi:hypothetical protein
LVNIMPAKRKPKAKPKNKVLQWSEIRRRIAAERDPQEQEKLRAELNWTAPGMTDASGVKL